MEPESPVWLNVIVAVLFFGGLFGVCFWLYTRQQRILQSLAEKHGLEYDEGGNTVVPYPSEKAIKRRGRFIKCQPEVRWHLKGEVDGVEVCLYKMYLRTGSSSDPKSRTWGYPYLIGSFVFDGVDLPKILIRPRSVFGKIRKWFIRRVDTPLERHPLDPHFVITTDSEDEFFKSFDDQASLLLFRRKKMTLEGFANSFYLFEKPSHLKFLLLTEASLEEFLQWGVKLAKELK